MFFETDSERLRAGIAANLEAFDARLLPTSRLKRAAVAIAVTTDEAGQPAFFLTKRATRLNRNSGQWALPGGRADPGEDAVTAALREMHEEIGVRLLPSQVLGRLDDYPTRSGYCITPVVVWAGPGIEAMANPDEVARLYRIPLAALAADTVVEMVAVGDSEHPMIRLRLVGNQIHAPTAALIYQFREVALAGRPTRVADLVQPGWTAR